MRPTRRGWAVIVLTGMLLGGTAHHWNPVTKQIDRQIQQDIAETADEEGP